MQRGCFVHVLAPLKTKPCTRVLPPPANPAPSPPHSPTPPPSKKKARATPAAPTAPGGVTAALYNPEGPYSKLLKKVQAALGRIRFNRVMLDAYEAEGFKSRSKDAGRPEADLLTARKAVLKDQAAIHSALREMDATLDECAKWSVFGNAKPPRTDRLSTAGVESRVVTSAARPSPMRESTALVAIVVP